MKTQMKKINEKREFCNAILHTNPLFIRKTHSHNSEIVIQISRNTKRRKNHEHTTRLL